jgi:hypothetical protein
MERSRHTKQPEVLRKMFKALETIPLSSRSVWPDRLAERLIADLSVKTKLGALRLCEPPKCKCEQGSGD